MSWAAAKDLADFARQKPALATVLVLAGLAGFCVWGFLGGFARGQDLTELETTVSTLTTDLGLLKDDVKDGRLEALEGQLFEARVAQCRAESRELKEVYAERVSKLLADYRDAGGGDLRLPQCSDL